MLMRFVWHTNRKTRNGGDRHAGHWQLGTDLSHNACFSAFKPIVEYAAVIGELLAGILIGPALLGWLAPSHTISLFAEIGVIIFDVSCWLGK